jgi:hypothetical protein
MRIDIVAATAFSTLLLFSSVSQAAGGAGGGGGTTPSRAPIGAPPSPNSDEINNAYEFRNKMSSDPTCQEVARQSDSVYADPDLDSDKKQKTLEQLRSRAKAAGCL